MLPSVIFERDDVGWFSATGNIPLIAPKKTSPLILKMHHVTKEFLSHQCVCSVH